MNRRALGFGFIALSTLVYISRFLTAAIYGSTQSSWSAELFQALLGYVDQGLSTAALVGLAVGVLFIGWSELIRRNQVD